MTQAVTALVTGAARGIGFAIASALVDSGWRVVACDVDPDSVRLALDRLPPNSALGLCADVRDTAAIENWLDQAGLVPELLVNNAAIAPRRATFELDAEFLDEVYSVNFRAPVLLAVALASRLIAVNRPGSIVNIASVNALRGQPEMLHYNATKAALVSATQTLAVEFAPHGIRVNAVLPGSTRTEIWSDGGWSDEIRERIAGSNLLKRLAEPSEIAATVVFLASSAASFMTGHSLIVDGGLTVKMT
jgi:NAD(P)-dependent dehydrogenase (short-subunit alcohol dehydrogenase family)